jgi:hypothetical protein
LPPPGRLLLLVLLGLLLELPGLDEDGKSANRKLNLNDQILLMMVKQVYVKIGCKNNPFYL